MLPRFLSESFEMLKHHQKEITGSFKEQLANPFDPNVAMKGFEAWRNAQNELLRAALTPWKPKNKSSEKSQHSNQAELETELDEMKQQIRQLQEKLKDL